MTAIVCLVILFKLVLLGRILIALSPEHRPTKWDQP